MGLINFVAAKIADRIEAKQQTAGNEDISKGGVVLGEGECLTDEAIEGLVRPIVISQGELNRHVYILGSTGCGKTVLLREFAYQLVKNGYGLFYIDGKGGPGTIETFHDIWRACVKFGKTDKFAFVSPVKSPEYCETSATWNPLLVFSKEEKVAVHDDAFKRSNNAKAEWYEDLKIDVITKIMSVFELTNMGYTYFDIEAALSGLAGAEELLKLCYNDAGEIIDQNVYMDTFNYVEEWRVSPRDALKNYKGTQMLMRALCSDLLAPLFCSTSPNWDPETALHQGQISFCYFPVMLNRRMMICAMKMLVASLKLALAHLQAYYGRAVKMALIIDEYNSLADGNQLDLFNKARDAGLYVIVAHQTQADLAQDMGSEYFGKSLFSNTTVKIIMQIKDMDTCEYLAKNLGTLPESPWSKLPLIGALFGEEKFIVDPNLLKGQTKFRDGGNTVGGFIADIDGKIWRYTPNKTRTPAFVTRSKIRIGVDIPKIRATYEPARVWEPLDFSKRVFERTHANVTPAGAMKSSPAKGGGKTQPQKKDYGPIKWN
ncbi:type IV secretion system DNA-binding domain-containing protein [Oryzomonas rubra]|uniref:DUF853 family protein n=1 Tax=Oryzomonas rubra TaxID=2509454 RepID=A0A5A9X4M9_9BACT|nr:helicase HerA-like domain-containing protein [Oryzomonas rubra]KAA0888102.1 DUF853 family protein [Oryzomonas rubra]